jgi:hypothetical protein
LTSNDFGVTKYHLSLFAPQKDMLNWILTTWDKISMWIAAQPTFVQVAVGIALFYAALQTAKLLYKLVAYLLAPLMATPRRFRKQQDLRSKPRRPKAAAPDDDSPPFVFR